jgi:hypothetical protein
LRNLGTPDDEFLATAFETVAGGHAGIVRGQTFFAHTGWTQLCLGVMAHAVWGNASIDDRVVVPDDDVVDDGGTPVDVACVIGRHTMLVGPVVAEMIPRHVGETIPAQPEAEAQTN